MYTPRTKQKSVQVQRKGKESKYSTLKLATSGENLLELYPKLRFDPDNPESLDLWKDLVKDATPLNFKKKLQYNPIRLDSLIENELSKMVNLQHSLVRALQQLGDDCTKVELLKLVSRLSETKVPYCLGGGSRPDTKRLIVMYEKDADVTAKKRNTYKRTVYGSAALTLSTAYKFRKRALPVSASSPSYSSSSSSSSGNASSAYRSHSLAMGDGFDIDNVTIPTGASLKHLYDNFDTHEPLNPLKRTRAVRKAPAVIEYSDESTQEFEEIDFNTDSWLQSYH